MSRTTPYTYYEAFVFPNFEDYRERPEDIRRGFNACVAASQMADIFFYYYNENDPSRIAQWKNRTALRIDLCKREPYFNTIQSAATAYKHLHAKGGHYEVSTAGSLESVMIPAIGSMDASYFEPDVIVRRLDASQVSLKAALEAVVERLWPSML
jgi:hypothetical protein